MHESPQIARISNKVPVESIGSHVPSSHELGASSNENYAHGRLKLACDYSKLPAHYPHISTSIKGKKG